MRRSRSRQALTTIRCSQLLTAASWRNVPALRWAESIASCSASAASSGLRLVEPREPVQLPVMTEEQLFEGVAFTGDMRGQQLGVAASDTPERHCRTVTNGRRPALHPDDGLGRRLNCDLGDVCAALAVGGAERGIHTSRFDVADAPLTAMVLDRFEGRGRRQHGGVVELGGAGRGRRADLDLGVGAGNVRVTVPTVVGCGSCSIRPTPFLKLGNGTASRVGVRLPGRAGAAVDGQPGLAGIVGFAVGGEDGGLRGFDDAAGRRGAGPSRRRRRTRPLRPSWSSLSPPPSDEHAAEHRGQDQQRHQDDGGGRAEADEQVAATGPTARAATGCLAAGGRRRWFVDRIDISVRSATAVACCRGSKELRRCEFRHRLERTGRRPRKSGRECRGR